jgi:two-component system, LytTR family, response regulator LytT
MQIIIIEDEVITASSLEETILRVEPSAVIAGRLRSVKEAKTYFSTAPLPDLIFGDIQLGDGLSFEVFAETGLDVPVIFCTAYDEYALKAFKANGIDYILKPFSTAAVADAIKRYHRLRRRLSGTSAQYDAILRILQERPSAKPSSILVHVKDRIIPVPLGEISLFYLEREVVQLHSFPGKVYLLTKSLDELERLAGNAFFRVNRQILLNRKAIRDTASSFSRTLTVNLSVPFNQTVTISRVKAPAFLRWLAEA